MTGNFLRGTPMLGLALSVGLAVPLAPTPILAQDAAAYPDFTFKRVKPPGQGVKKRITVQIDPDSQPRPKPAAVAKPTPSPEAPVVSGRYGWFWDSIAADAATGGPWRLDPALQALSKPPQGNGVRAPSLASLMEIAQARGKDILLTTAGTEVSPALVLAVIAVESAGRADAVSRAGAAGLMQLMPATAERFGVADRLVAAQNIRGGVAFLNLLMQQFQGDPILVLAGYNAGENAVRNFGGVPPYAETRDYVPKVLEAYRVARGLCITPPMLISDGCVFRLPKA